MFKPLKFHCIETEKSEQCLFRFRNLNMKIFNRICIQAFQRFQTELFFPSVYLWAQLFKTNDVVSKRFVKISNVNILNLPIFFAEKM